MTSSRLLEYPWTRRDHGADPKCERCNGSGWVQIDEGASRCPDCEAIYTSKAIIRSAEIPRRFEKSTVREFEVGTAAQLAARDAIASWVKKYELGGAGLYLYGPVGTGKTHLGCAALKGLSPRGIWSLYRSLPELLLDLRRAVRDGEESDVLDALVDVPVLMLDDVGTERLTEFASERLHQLIDCRYTHRRTLVVTSNISPANLGKHLSPRLASRLLEMCRPVRVDGLDYRQKLAEAH